ncbi:hypothetical protein HYPSUDRAFT_200797 [Hypholoma sublateritium FD-334 SS-4]|uniref:Uncharacterized protein n=1 Tax=Hypholoma sublateritium (strain FD-334 SS-4) TaxID=945553 RepID=A0A0D2LAQ5_HYPSF|nr:hypothetical protein HYPSUDRAFT_200797 [Hypholoma sublateritium FD-334 SS-4]
MGISIASPALNSLGSPTGAMTPPPPAPPGDVPRCDSMDGTLSVRAPGASGRGWKRGLCCYIRFVSSRISSRQPYSYSYLPQPQPAAPDGPTARARGTPPPPCSVPPFKAFGANYNRRSGDEEALVGGGARGAAAATRGGGAPGRPSAYSVGRGGNVPDALCAAGA